VYSIGLGIGEYFPVIFLVVFVLGSIVVTETFADTVTISIASGSGVPGCEDTNECFLPTNVVIENGDTVIWINRDNIAHTVTSGTPSDGPDGNFDSSMVMSSFDYSVKFSQLGTFEYFCMLHPWSVGTVTVKSITSYTPPPTPTPYVPPTPSGTDWEDRYYDMLSKFNDVSAKVGELDSANNLLRQQISELEKKVNDLNAIIMEQIKVIYEWVIGK